MNVIYRKIARRIPGLGLKLRQARLAETPEEYVKRIFFTALYLTLGILIIAYLFVLSPYVLVGFPILFPMLFAYMAGYVDVKVQKLNNAINQEIIFAGRFLLIELESGVPLYDTFKNLAKNYESIGKYFSEIVEKVDLGTEMEDAINEAIMLTPSPNFRKLLWQVLNSLKTGSDVTDSLNVVIDQIVREQQISVKEYGRKLNPIAMFYMMAAIIVPSLGTTMLIVMATFIGFQLSLPVLLVISGLIGFMQFMFLSIIKTMRPPMEL
ncbi:type II secretion system F family protein [Candidatus Woesearchaeota archaeon]|nr:type II secretion system F family protein [Candidatus Woesearchaeota archaeon]